MPERKPAKRLSVRPAVYLSIFGPTASLLVFVARWVFLHKNEQDFSLDITNFLVVLLPFAFSIFFAFVPDMRERHIAWRVCVIAIGLGFSWLLWKQQHLAAAAARRDQIAAVSAAVAQSNQHSDQQIAGVRTDVQTTTQALDKKLSEVSKQVLTSEREINGNVSKLSAPKPEFAKLQFSLFEQGALFPITTQSLIPDKDGIFTIDFIAKNVSDAMPTKSGDLWIYVCDYCIFAGEVPGFDKPNGLVEAARHKLFSNINPGVTLEKMTIKVKLKNPHPDFQIGFKYACETCGKIQDAQLAKILAPAIIGAP